jgi:hypothetical protein
MVRLVSPHFEIAIKISIQGSNLVTKLEILIANKIQNYLAEHLIISQGLIFK